MTEYQLTETKQSLPVVPIGVDGVGRVHGGSPSVHGHLLVVGSRSSGQMFWPLRPGTKRPPV
ncbi:hypothetical protein HNP00_004144 [Arthrobacter sp. AZCC_0090]|nr:hypothetical protein [Arthrobacter sp. AZCC_0090]